MSVYSYDKLIEETRKLAAEFRRTTGTMLPVSGEIARHDVSHLLGLELNQDQITDELFGKACVLTQGESNILKDIEIREQGAILKQHPHALSQGIQLPMV